MSTKAHVITGIDRVDASIISALGELTAATVHEAYGGRGALNSYLRPIGPRMKLCGTAVTVQARPGDNLIVHKALKVAQPGDVLVVGTSEYTEAGLWGEVMARAAQQRGIVGLITDGAVRDSVEIADLGFPIFSKALCIKGTTKNCVGYINHPLVLAGQTINPGDIILADPDGIVVVAPEDAESVIEKAKQREDKEKKVFKALAEGKTTLDLYNFDDKLQALGLTEG